MPPQSFASITRDQLVRLPLGKICCMAHELRALYKTAGTLTLHGLGRVQCAYHVESVSLARRIMRLIKARLQIVPSVYVINHTRLGGQKTCVLQLSEADSRKLLIALHIMEQDEHGREQFKRMLPRRALTRNCCRRAFLRGAFLGGGYVSNPEKSYHMEIMAQEEAFAGMLAGLIRKSGLPAKTIIRREVPVVYLKGSQAITDFLTLIGAHDAVIRIEDIRVKKAVRNRVNRLMNCDNANMEKQLNASERQTDAIAALVGRVGIEGLPDKLREIAVLRLREPEASLVQLGEMMMPKLGKSGVSHRLKKIESLAQEALPGAGNNALCKREDE